MWLYSDFFWFLCHNVTSPKLFSLSLEQQQKAQCVSVSSSISSLTIDQLHNSIWYAEKDTHSQVRFWRLKCEDFLFIWKGGHWDPTSDHSFILICSSCFQGNHERGTFMLYNVTEWCCKVINILETNKSPLPSRSQTCRPVVWAIWTLKYQYNSIMCCSDHIQ